MQELGQFVGRVAIPPQAGELPDRGTGVAEIRMNAYAPLGLHNGRLKLSATSEKSHELSLKQQTRCKMNKTKIIFYFCLVVIVLFNFAFAELTEKTASNIKEKNVEKTNELSPATPQTQNVDRTPEASRLPEKVLVQEKNPSLANYILVADVLDGFGGQRYNGGCDLSYFAGGQSSPIGAGTSPSYKLQAGFIYSSSVLCGDANADGLINSADVAYLINYLFVGGPVPKPFQAGEANCDGFINSADVAYLINYLFVGGPLPIC